MSNLRTTDFRKLNSATKYPSIPTYHEIGDRGRLRESVLIPFEGEVIVTEKIDGTSVRIIVSGDDYVVGSREEFLTARGDRVCNPALSIVDSLAWLGVLERVLGKVSDSSYVVFYGEVYGLKSISGYKSYGDGSHASFRLFDVTVSTAAAMDELFAQELEQVSRWREGGGQPFVEEDALLWWAERIGVEVTPRSGRMRAPPASLSGAHDWLKAVLPGRSAALVDGEPTAKPEGVVIRTQGRVQIAKLRFEDYERTLRAEGARK